MADELSWDEREVVDDENVNYDSPFDDINYPDIFM